MKKVSVIVPVYNVEKYLEACLNSLVHQTLKDIEILVVNDGSPDNSQKIIEDFEARYPDLVRGFQKENGGQGSARNLGISHATGEFLSFIDSDDWLDEETLEQMYGLGQKEKADIVICDMYDHLEDGTSKIYNCTQFASPYEVTPSASNKIFRRSFVGELRFVEKIWYEDFNFTSKLFLRNPKAAVISKPYYHCNSRAVSTMNNNNSRKNLDIITAMEDIRDYAEKNQLYDENILDFLVFHHILTTSINRVANQKNPDRRAVLKEMTRYCRRHLKGYGKLPFYSTLSFRKKLIGRLNYLGMSGLSKMIFSLKSSLSK